jgi:hypothetical protein
MTAMHRRAAWAALRGRRRTLAVRHYMRAVVGGDLKSIGRAAFAFAHPAVGSDRLFTFLGRDPEWIAKAKPWIEAFAAASGGEQSSQ